MTWYLDFEQEQDAVFTSVARIVDIEGNKPPTTLRGDAATVALAVRGLTGAGGSSFPTVRMEANGTAVPFLQLLQEMGVNVILLTPGRAEATVAAGG